MRASISLLALLTVGSPAPAPDAPPPVVVASKPFGESYLLAEIFARLLESHGVAVVRRPGLGATEIAFAALRTGAIDVYPEYTGTGLRVILQDTTTGLDAGAVFHRVARQTLDRHGVRWLPPLGFENTYAIAMTRQAARTRQIATLSDLGRRGADLRAGLTADFIGRADGLPALRRRTGWTPRSVQPLAPALKYEALRTGAVDLIDGYSTDGALAQDSLAVLTDDAHVFPPYEASALVSRRMVRERPDVVATLTLLSGRIEVARMRAWNRRVEVDHASIAAVAEDALQELGLAAADAGTTAEVRTSVSPIAAAWRARAELPAYLIRHLQLVAAALSAAIAVGGLLGAWLSRAPRGGEVLMRILGAIQTIPSLALLAFCIPLLGVGVVPALLALWLYAIYPIAQATATGLRYVDPRIIGAATAVGLDPREILHGVRLPLAAPAILAGIRTSTVITIGGATLAAFVGAGGLGEPITTGLALNDQGLVLLGAVPAALLALVADAALSFVARRATPAFLRGGAERPTSSDAA